MPVSPIPCPAHSIGSVFFSVQNDKLNRLPFYGMQKERGQGFGVEECKRAFDGSKKYAELNMMGNCNGDFN